MLIFFDLTKKKSASRLHNSNKSNAKHWKLYKRQIRATVFNYTEPEAYFNRYNIIVILLKVIASSTILSSFIVN